MDEHCAKPSKSVFKAFTEATVYINIYMFWEYGDGGGVIGVT